ncbi:MAG: DegV family protein [Dehalococcoidia bacterium]|nr:DegV family protein [Dehalococcoidia bacterium]
MKIVVDSGVDLGISPAEIKELNIQQIPLSVSFKGITYREGVDIGRDEFYSMLEENRADFPITSQPSPGQFIETYKAAAAEGQEVLSIHLSSGLSGTYNAARVAAGLVPQAKVTLVDTKTLSIGSGWQAVAAARAIKLGKTMEQVLALTKQVGEAADALFTLQELRYLRHGGRISHIKGLLASLLNIKPIIGVEKDRGTYVQMGQARNFTQAIEALTKIVARKHAEGIRMRAQVVHARNPEGAELLKNAMDKLFKCKWLPPCPVSLVLGAHTGPSVVGLIFAPEAALEGT